MGHNKFGSLVLRCSYLVTPGVTHTLKYLQLYYISINHSHYPTYIPTFLIGIHSLSMDDQILQDIDTVIAEAEKDLHSPTFPETPEENNIPPLTEKCQQLVDNSQCNICKKKKKYKKRCKRHSLTCGCGWRAKSKANLQAHRFPTPKLTLRRHLPPLQIPSGADCEYFY